MNVVYRLEGSSLGRGHARADFPPDCRLVAWKPSLFRVIPDHIRFEKFGFLKNWLFHFPRLVSGRKLYSVYSLVSGSEVLCQCILTPGSSRFHFMDSEDFQFGLVYTSPSHRRKHLASAMIRAILAEAPNPGSYWWLTEAENAASRKLAEGAGFKLLAKQAVRKTVLGFSYYTLQ